MFAMIFNYFCKCFKCVFQVFHLSFLYVVSVASECFKSRSCVAHVIRVGNGRGASGPRESDVRAARVTQCGRATSGRHGHMHVCAKRRGKTDCSHRCLDALGVPC
jgi:hypothetical protein